MTAQIPDRLAFGEITYSLVDANGGPLFEPMDNGVYPVMFSTACVRGYSCTYEIVAKHLVLRALLLGSTSRVRGEPIHAGVALFGTLPDLDEPRGVYRFMGLDVPVPFTGGLLLGHGFIREFAVRVGFQPARSYRTVLELLVDEGRLRDWHERSELVEQLREPTDSPERARDARSIRDGFSRRYAHLT